MKNNKDIEKFIFLTDLISILKLRRVKISLDKLNHVLYYKNKGENGDIYFDIMKPYGYFDVSKVDYVVLTLPKNVVKEIIMKQYKYYIDNDTIKIIVDRNNKDTLGLEIPIRFFEIMVMQVNFSEISQYLYDLCNVELYNKNRQKLAYAISNIWCL